MSMFKILDIAGSAVSAQSQRLNVVASNLANADTVAGPDGTAYKARQVVFQTTLLGAAGQRDTSAGVKVSTITEDQTPGRRVHEQHVHPSLLQVLQPGHVVDVRIRVQIGPARLEEEHVSGHTSSWQSPIPRSLRPAGTGQ